MNKLPLTDHNKFEHADNSQKLFDGFLEIKIGFPLTAYVLRFFIVDLRLTTYGLRV